MARRNAGARPAFVSSGTETACDSKRVKSGQDAREPPTRCRRSREEPRCDLFGKATYVSCWLRFRFASITPSKPQSESSSISCIATTLGLLAMTSAAKSAGRLSPTSRLPRAINTNPIVMRSSSPKRSPRSKLKPLKQSTFSASSKLPRFRRHSLIHHITWAPTDRLPRNLTPSSGKCCKTPARLAWEKLCCAIAKTWLPSSRTRTESFCRSFVIRPRFAPLKLFPNSTARRRSTRKS